MVRFKRITPLIFMAAMALSPGCADKKADSEVPAKSEAVKLGQLLKRPADYAGKTVAVEGNFFPSCCEEDFVLKDGAGQITVVKTGELMKFKPKAARPVRVAGIVRSTEESTYIQATALEVR